MTTFSDRHSFEERHRLVECMYRARQRSTWFEAADDLPAQTQRDPHHSTVPVVSLLYLLNGAKEPRKTNGSDGRVSIQTDPRLYRDPQALLAQAERFSKLAPNIIVKIPATRIGLQVIERAVALGVSVNATVSFTVPQAIAGGEAIERGIALRGGDDSGVDPGCVVTLMGGRLDDWLKESAGRSGILFEPGVLDWAGVAAAKKAYGIFRERGYRSRLLVGAFRSHLLFSEFIGGDLVITIPAEWQDRIQASGIAVDTNGIARPPAFIDVGSAAGFRDESVDYAARIWQACRIRPWLSPPAMLKWPGCDVL